MSFDFNTGSQQESDPTADFLARERAAAGELEGDADLFGSSQAAPNTLNAAARQTSLGADRDFENSASAFPALDGDEGFATTASHGAGAPGLGDDLLGAGTQATPAPRVMDERDQFESNFPELNEEFEEPAAPASVSG